jgi:hypothetical protein
MGVAPSAWEIVFVIDETCDGAHFEVWNVGHFISSHSSSEGAYSRIPVRERRNVTHAMRILPATYTARENTVPSLQDDWD